MSSPCGCEPSLDAPHERRGLTAEIVLIRGELLDRRCQAMLRGAGALGCWPVHTVGVEESHAGLDQREPDVPRFELGLLRCLSMARPLALTPTSPKPAPTLETGQIRAGYAPAAQSKRLPPPCW